VWGATAKSNNMLFNIMAYIGQILQK